MDIIFTVACIIGALIGGIAIGYKVGRAIRRDRFEANTSAREKAQKALSVAQETVRNMEDRIPFLLIELPRSQYDTEKQRVDNTVKRLEDSVVKLVEPIEEARQLQTRRLKTSPDNYHLNSSTLTELTASTQYETESLVRRVNDLQATVHSLKPENLSLELDAIQVHSIDKFKKHIRTSEVKSASNRRGSHFKNFAEQVSIAQRSAESIAASIKAGHEDRYVLQMKITQLKQDCENLWEVYYDLDPSARFIRWAEVHFSKHPDVEFIDD